MAPRNRTNHSGRAARRLTLSPREGQIIYVLKPGEPGSVGAIDVIVHSGAQIEMDRNRFMSMQDARDLATRTAEALEGYAAEFPGVEVTHQAKVYPRADTLGLPVLSVIGSADQLTLFNEALVNDGLSAILEAYPAPARQG